jgi:hypothetical protein
MNCNKLLIIYKSIRVCFPIVGNNASLNEITAAFLQLEAYFGQYVNAWHSYNNNVMFDTVILVIQLTQDINNGHSIVYYKLRLL